MRPDSSPPPSLPSFFSPELPSSPRRRWSASPRAVYTCTSVSRSWEVKRRPHYKECGPSASHRRHVVSAVLHLPACSPGFSGHAEPGARAHGRVQVAPMHITGRVASLRAAVRPPDPNALNAQLLHGCRHQPHLLRPCRTTRYRFTRRTLLVRQGQVATDPARPLGFSRAYIAVVRASSCLVTPRARDTRTLALPWSW